MIKKRIIKTNEFVDFIYLQLKIWTCILHSLLIISYMHKKLLYNFGANVNINFTYSKYFSKNMKNKQILVDFGKKWDIWHENIIFFTHFLHCLNSPQIAQIGKD